MAAAAFFVRIRLPGDRKGDGGGRKSAGASGNRRQKRGGGEGEKQKKPRGSRKKRMPRGKPRQTEAAKASLGAGGLSGA